MNRSRYIPSGSAEIKLPDIEAVVYWQNSQNQATGKPVITAMAYHGKKTNYDWYLNFRTLEQREQKTYQFFAGIYEWQQAQVARRNARVEFTHGYKVGDILHTMWGYDQTNIEFWQVTKIISSKMIEVREVASGGEQTGFMCGDTWPIPGGFISKPVRCLVTGSKGRGELEDKGSIHVPAYEGAKERHCTAWAWDGRKMHNSWYA